MEGRAICSAIRRRPRPLPSLISVIAEELPFRLPAIHSFIHPLRECDGSGNRCEKCASISLSLSSHFQCHSCPARPRPPGCQCHPLRLVTNEGVCERRPARCPRAAPPPSPLSRRAALQMGISRSSLTLRLRVRTCAAAAAAAIPPTDLPPISFSLPAQTSSPEI